ncbi:MAG: hypothetical protein B7Z83_07600 [Thiomonas sp. 20-64-5]|nr:MAG: hypothetical protein B7Z83_07600 [Thiomonas sp. 20-64-5]
MVETFIHLRVHSGYSLAEGAIKVVEDKAKDGYQPVRKDLIKLCLKHNMPAVALTDKGNLFGALEFSTAATDAGVQPIIGCQLAVLRALKTQWAGRIAAMRQWLLMLVQSADCPLNKQSYAERSVRGWFDAIDVWLNDSRQLQPAIDDKVWDKLTPDGLRAKCNKGKSVDVPTAFDAVDVLRAALAA